MWLVNRAAGSVTSYASTPERKPESAISLHTGRLPVAWPDLSLNCQDPIPLAETAVGIKVEVPAPSEVYERGGRLPGIDRLRAAHVFEGGCQAAASPARDADDVVDRAGVGQPDLDPAGPGVQV